MAGLLFRKKKKKWFRGWIWSLSPERVWILTPRCRRWCAVKTLRGRAPHRADEGWVAASDARPWSSACVWTHPACWADCRCGRRGGGVRGDHDGRGARGGGGCGLSWWNSGKISSRSERGDRIVADASGIAVNQCHRKGGRQAIAQSEVRGVVQTTGVRPSQIWYNGEDVSRARIALAKSDTQVVHEKRHAKRSTNHDAVCIRLPNHRVQHVKSAQRFTNCGGVCSKWWTVEQSRCKRCVRLTNHIGEGGDRLTNHSRICRSRSKVDQCRWSMQKWIKTRGAEHSKKQRRKQIFKKGKFKPKTNEREN